MIISNNIEYNLFYEYLILIPAITFCITVFLKGIFIKLRTGKVDITRALGSGGMPSVHSSVVVSLTAAIALKYGIDSDFLAIAVSFSLIILYDAINVRFEAGQHAKAINERLGEKKFKESLGHLPSEVFVGSLLGIIIAMFIYYI